VDTLLIVATCLAFLVGGLASSGYTTRLLRPLSVLTQAARRVGKGDLEVRAVVEGKDEVAALASEFNEMASHLRQYRQSSLGDLLQAQSAAQSAIDSLPDAVVIFGMDGHVLAANTLAEGELHITLDAGAPLSRVEPALRAALEQVKAHVLAGKGPYQPRGFEEAIRSAGADGERYLLARATPVYDADGSGLRGATVVLQDVTRLRRFDELKNDLVATVAHEFRTPLTSLRMAIHLCLEGAAGDLAEKQRDLLQAGRDDCERLQGIVDDLLDLSKLQSGHEELHRQGYTASTLAGQAAEQLRPLAQERHIELKVEDLADGMEAFADAERLQLVFSNLLTNAIRYTPEGQTVTLRTLPAPGHVRFEIQDAGPGVSPEFQERIFEKYFRAPGGKGGTAGLGLYISKEIVAAHGGEIGVVSKPGEGSTFWFTVPRKSAPGA
jgi:signal transduction histidine kinase/HAMP domain-containing protein